MTLKALYKTVWEIKQRVLVDMAADRGAYIDQSQSFNVHMSDPNYGKLTSLHFYTWKKGLKTGACRREKGGKKEAAPRREKKQQSWGTRPQLLPRMHAAHVSVWPAKKQRSVRPAGA